MEHNGDLRPDGASTEEPGVVTLTHARRFVAHRNTFDLALYDEPGSTPARSGSTPPYPAAAERPTVTP